MKAAGWKPATQFDGRNIMARAAPPKQAMTRHADWHAGSLDLEQRN
jgi:hypothetical protein